MLKCIRRTPRARKQLLGASGEFDVRFAAALVAYADMSPRNRVAERFARGLLRGKRAGEPLRAIAMALRVRDLRLR